MDEIVFNVLLLKGESGNSIRNIEKTATSGTVDTYTVTLTDGSTTTFEVTNGSNIESINKTSASGLVDTYTVTLTNGNTSTFTVTNGNGIENITKTGTSGNTDTYTITYTNGNTSTFTVTNGTNAVDTELSVDSTNPVENRVITSALNAINNHLMYRGSGAGSDYATAIQNLVLTASADQNPSPNSSDILDIIGTISITGQLGTGKPCYGTLGCNSNAQGRGTLVGVISTTDATYRVLAVKPLASSAWSDATVTVTAI